MAAAPGADDGSTPMEVEAVQNADQRLHRLLIRGCAIKESNKVKVQNYIEGLCMGLQLGEVKVSERMDLHGLLVEFDCSKAKECVKNITLEIDGNEPCPAFSTAPHPQDIQHNVSVGRLDQLIQGFHSTTNNASPGLGTVEWSSATETPYQEHQDIGKHKSSPSIIYGRNVNGQHRSPVFGNTSSPCELPMVTAVQLDLESLDPALRGRVLDLIRISHLKCSVLINGKVTFEGLFEDVARLNEAVNDLLNNVPGKPNAGQVANASKDRRAAEMQSPDRKSSITEEQNANQLRLSLFHYDYLNKVWADQMSVIQQRYNVDLLTEVVLKLQPKEQQGQSKVKEALEALTESIQPLLNDLGRVKLTVPDSDRANLSRAFKDMQARKSFYLTELEEGFAITGPRRHIERVKDELLELLKSTSRQRATLKIESDMATEKTALKMTRFHWELLENIFKDDLKSICSRYQVQIEPDIESFKGDFRILVKNQGAAQDLSVHALQAFILLYQKAVTSSITRAVESHHSNCMQRFYEYKRHNYPGVRLLPGDGGGLVLLGLPHHVELAVRDIEQCLGKKVFIPTASRFKGGISQSGISVSSQGNAEGASGAEDEENRCSICLSPFTDKMTTECKHSFCKECWNQAIAVKPQCPICKKTYGKVLGDQPDGTMTVSCSTMNLPGFKGYGMIGIDYNFPSGMQSNKHPNPGKPYSGTNRKAYLPDNREGNEVLRLLRKAFDQKLIFTIGVSRTTGSKDVVTWNDIHHKTNTYGGPTQFGYPDPDYLQRVRDELHAKGIE